MSLLPPEVEGPLRHKEPFLWPNDLWRPMPQSRREASIDFAAILDAARRLQRLGPVLAKLFPELAGTQGIIESSLYPADELQKALMPPNECRGRWLIKGDHALPIAGSIKARGGIYEVLLRAEQVALHSGLMKPGEDPLVLLSRRLRGLFAQHQIGVGSTGNLGLSVGVMAAALGFHTAVHMSRDAKSWKKVRLRGQRVEVVEHAGDYGAAVAAGREQADQNPNAYFVDDENSRHLFLGYSVSAIRLQAQLHEQGIAVDAQHPLFVYLPCGVGGAAGGITFGLRHVFGDHVHCFFAEPVASPCVLLRLACNENRPISVTEVGLDNRTEADGLAVGQASELVVQTTRALISGVFTVADDDLFEDLFLLEKSEGLRIEPSAAAGFRGPRWLLTTQAGQLYLRTHGLSDRMNETTHLLWTTGGLLVPAEEYGHFREHGRRVWMCRNRSRDIHA